jgi:hypothetical protein
MSVEEHRPIEDLAIREGQGLLFSWKARISLTAAFLNPENSLEAIWLGGGILKIR